MRDDSTNRTKRSYPEARTDVSPDENQPHAAALRDARSSPDGSSGRDGSPSGDAAASSGNSEGGPSESSEGGKAGSSQGGTEGSSQGGTEGSSGSGTDGNTRVTVLVALAANLLIAVAKAVGGVVAGSPALLSEAAHSVADSLNEVFLLAALRRSRRPADRQHPFGYGKERFFWSLLAAVGIFVMGGCFSFFQGVEALRKGADETHTGYLAGLVVLGVALVAEGASLMRALHQVRRQGGREGLRDPALRTVVAEDGTAVLGVSLAIVGMALHMLTGQVAWEASASLAIGVLLVYVAYRLGRDARDQLIGQATDPEETARIRALLEAQPEIDSVEALLTMEMGLESTLVAARIDLVPGLDSEEVEEVAVRIKRSVSHTFPAADQIFLDVTDAGATRAAVRAAQGDHHPGPTRENPAPKDTESAPAGKNPAPGDENRGT